MKLFLLIAVMAFIPQLSLASDGLSHYRERFEIQINTEGEKVIVDKSILEDLKIETYVKSLATYLSVSDTDVENEVFACKGYVYEEPDLDIGKSYAAALDWIKKTDIGKFLVDEKFLKFIKEMEGVTQQYTSDPSFATVANLDNSTYFFKKTFIKFLSNKLIDLAKSYFGATAYLKIVTYIGDDYSRFIVHKKMYHQNILAYYLENFRADQLGLTESEKRRALSSIRDSRLSFGFGGYFESNKIKKDFAEYGYKKLLEADKSGEKRWSKHAALFNDRLFKINSSFSEASFGQSAITINVGVKKDKGDDRPSYVYDDACPDFLYKNRRRYEMSRIALGMSPIPYTGKLFTLIKSKYQSQALSEGMYYAHLESTEQEAKKAVVLKQSMNPLLH